MTGSLQTLLRSEERGEAAAGAAGAAGVSVSEPAGSEAAKFRLWVKSKGLALSRPGPLQEEEEEEEEEETPLLFVPTGTDKVSQTTPKY